MTSRNKTFSNECLSSSTLEIVIDDRSVTDSVDEDSNSQTRHPKSGTTDDEHITYRRRKQITLKNTTKSHRLIEKRRRDRMNRSLTCLLNLIPHKKPESQRRIEKTEIIEMAIEHIRCLISSNQKTSEPVIIDKKSNSKLDVYRTGYHNGTCDTYEYIEKNPDNNRFHTDLIRYIKEKETQLKDLTVVPAKKGHLKAKASLLEKSASASCDNICAISDTTTSENIFQQANSIEQTKVPIFVLHPSGTHYIPMCIDSSIVSHAFNNKSNSDKLQCHPVSIPVNFNPSSAISDPYELDIQNINVIGTRHQTSVRPN